MICDHATQKTQRSQDYTRRIAVGATRPAIGFACLWDQIPERTWSYTAWNLRAGLAHTADVIDIGVQIPPLPRTLLKALYMRWPNGCLTSTWKFSKLTDTYGENVLRHRLSRVLADSHCDAVLTIQDMADLPIPFFTYQDLSWDALTAANQNVDGRARLLGVTGRTIARRRERQLALYARAAGVIAMSHWLARSLIQQSGLSPEKVHVVRAGVSANREPSFPGSGAGTQASRGPRPIPQRDAPRRRLLFVGGDFYRKGGDLVVAALARLRREYDRKITLTVAGPKTWPLPGDLPPGVRFLGPLPTADVAALYDTHDLFVMPSRLEPFGIVFAEAITRGLPCVARDAYAMPEIVTPGVSGALVTGDDDGELAATIAAVLAEDGLYAACRDQASTAAAYFSWERAGREVVTIINETLGVESPRR